MKAFASLAFAASLALVAAQDLTGIPTCALACFATAVPASGCSLTDIKCQCTTGQASITQSILACVPSKCSADDIGKIAPAVEALCKNAGITLSNLPTAASTGGNGAGVSQTGSATGSHTAGAVNTGAAVANVANIGAVALGIMAAWL